MIEEAAVLVLRDDRYHAVPQRGLAADSAICFQQEFLTASYCRRCMIIAAEPKVRGVGIGGFEEDDLGKLTGWGVLNVVEEFRERPKLFGFDNSRDQSR